MEKWKEQMEENCQIRKESEKSEEKENSKNLVWFSFFA